ncbi:hypothetical protein ACIQV3_21235 [Streptomyces sp. NPDC099050]|uniref:terpene synthase family protein n=1 Tax=Streptomyces sp. NPDC099050 TaxID=3366100 RepID=UPI0038018C4C
MTAFAIPDLYCPFPFTPPDPGHLELARTELATWLDRFPIGERYLRAGGVEFAAYTTPGPADPAPLSLTAQFHTWLFATDDTYCDEARQDAPAAYLTLLPQLLTVLDPPFLPVTSTHHFVAALADLRDRLLRSAAPHQVLRFADGMREALLSLAWELPVRAGAAPLGIDAYRSLRRRNGAVGPCIELSALISGIAPSTDELGDPRVQELTTLAIDHIGIANDLWSYTKETREPGPVPTLLPHVLMAERRISLPEAVTETARLCDNLIAAFETGASRLEPTAPPQIVRHLDVLRTWIRGNLEWSAHCRRYHHDSGAAAARTGASRWRPARSARYRRLGPG